MQAEGALDKAWDETNVEKKTRVKLGGGFYCGQIEVDGVKCARQKEREGGGREGGRERERERERQGETGTGGQGHRDRDGDKPR